jgi:hypothetical protein
MARAAEADVEQVPAPAETPTPAKEEKPALPDGYVTPIGLAKILSKHYDKDYKPQMVYSYIKNAPKDHPFPLEEVNGRKVVNAEAGLKWFVDKDARVAERRANSEAKAAKKAAKAEGQSTEQPAQEAE